MTALPPVDDLSRWTMNQVTDWLMKNSLGAFRDAFVSEQIDGSKLARLSPSEIDKKYKQVPVKKRNHLKDLLSKIDNSPRPAGKWASPPSLPPRPKQQPPRVKADSESDDDGWDDSDFAKDESEDDTADDYVEPTPGPRRAAKSDVSDSDGDDSYIDPVSGPRADSIDAPPPRPPKPGRPGQNLPAVDTSKKLPKPNLLLPPRPVPVVRESNGPRDEEVYEPVDDEEKAEDDEDYMEPDPVTSTEKNDTFIKPPPRLPQQTSPQVQRPQRSLPVVPTPDKSQPQRPPASKIIPPPPPQAKKAVDSKNQNDLSSFPWFHGNIQRAEADRIFQREQAEGMFLVRKSERNPNQPYTLVLWHSSRLWNLPIRLREDKQYAAGTEKKDESSFETIEQLIEHFRHNSLNLKGEQGAGPAKLCKPVPRH